MPPSDEGGVKICDFDGGRDIKILYLEYPDIYLSYVFSPSDADKPRQLPRQREPKKNAAPQD